MKNEALSWFKQAREDLRYANSAIEDDYFAWTCFACQQSVEKALKAYLVEKTSKVDKIHLLLELLGKCEKLDSEFNILRDKLDILTQYYGPTRYADLHSEKSPYEFYTREMAEEAIQFAMVIVNFIDNKLVD